MSDFEDDDFDAVEALLKQADIKEDKKKPSKETEVEDTESTEDDGNEDASEAEDEATDDTEAGEDADEADETGEDEADETEVTTGKKIVIEPEADAYVKINGKEIKVSELTKLHGQDAELTTRTAESVAAKSASDAHATRYVAGLEEMLQRAVARAEPYAKINFLALTKDPNVSQEELTALNAEAQKAYEDVQYLKTSLDGVVEDMHKQRHQQLVKQGQEAWKVLSDPEKGIKDWNEATYKEVSSFAVSQGIDKRVIDELVDPAAIRMLHMAMLYSKGAKATTTTKKVDKSPKKILKGTTEAVTQKARPKPGNKAFDKLRETGSIDDATDAFLARMAD